MDAIGVPRGVPDEFKTRNQITAGFKSTLFWWSTINKNVDWINYTYYNLQRFTNNSRDSVRGTAEQLGSTNKMARENQMVLDMILVEKCGDVSRLGVNAAHSSPTTQLRWDHHQGSPRSDSPVK
jgi:hypothetical protein